MGKLTAMVTGASEGLGRSIALELAKRNIDLVLVSLPESGLESLSEYIRKNFGINVTYMLADLTDAQTYLKLFKTLCKEDISVQILVNNAGLGNLAWFKEEDIDFYQQQIQLNVVTPVVMTRLFLDQVRDSQESYVLNVGSLVAQFLVPRKQVYGATKSFISYFTRCLQLEFENSNTNVSLLSPGGINTKPELLVLNHSLKGIAKATILEPEDVAKAAIDGLFKRKKVIIPGVVNNMLFVLDFFLPAALKKKIIMKKLSTKMKK